METQTIPQQVLKRAKAEAIESGRARTIVTDGNCFIIRTTSRVFAGETVAAVFKPVLEYSTIPEIILEEV